MKYLVDSNIIIYHLNNESLATAFLLNNAHQCAISQITYIEVLSFPFSPEQERDVKNLLESFKIIDINREVAVQATINRKIRKIKIPASVGCISKASYTFVSEEYRSSYSVIIPL